MRNHVKFRHKRDNLAELETSSEAAKKQSTLKQYHQSKQALSKPRYEGITRLWP